MINVPKGLAPHEVDLYISAFKFCEKLIQEQNTDIGAAVTETTEKYSESAKSLTQGMFFCAEL